MINPTDDLVITMAGPIQTIATGTLGLILIFWRRKKADRISLNFFDWFSIFLSLFWLREVFNLLLSISQEIINPDGSFFDGDEQKISAILNLSSGTFSIILGIIGLAVFGFILFKVIPIALRLTFVLSGLIGSIVGFLLWMNALGPLILP